jgi:hypothetical protein
MKPYSQIKDYLAPDGALRDFYIQDIGKPEWDRFIAIAPRLVQRAVFSWGEQELPLPAKFSDIYTMQQKNPTMLSMWVAGSKVNCHFFTDSEIELDFVPNDFQDEKKWIDLFAFFQALVNALGKKGVMTHENSKESVIDEVLPNT